MNEQDRKSTRLNSSHLVISYAVFCLIPCRTYRTLVPYATLFRSGGAAGVAVEFVGPGQRGGGGVGPVGGRSCGEEGEGGDDRGGDQQDEPAERPPACAVSGHE